MLSDTDAACRVINLALCLGTYDTPLHQRKVQRETTTHTPTSHKRCAEEVQLLQNRLLFEGQLFFE
jgi:hypothetical protein